MIKRLFSPFDVNEMTDLLTSLTATFIQRVEFIGFYVLYLQTSQDLCVVQDIAAGRYTPGISYKTLRELIKAHCASYAQEPAPPALCHLRSKNVGRQSVRHQNAQINVGWSYFLT